MKNIPTLLVIIILSIIVSCQKESDPETPTTQKAITYPDSIYHGQSILTLPDSAIVVNGMDYGFAANLEKDASLLITITDLSPIDSTGYHPKWYYALPVTGWLPNEWNDGKQKFTATQTGKIDLRIEFQSGGDTGICRLDFYENGATITKTKYLRWQ
jgi:hypothetical protein